MNMKAPAKSSGNFEPAPQGNQRAILVGMYHFGSQPHTYMGEEKKRDEMRLTFELSDSLSKFGEGEDEKPFMISKSCTFSMNSKAFMRKAVEACIGTSLTDSEAENFEVEQVLGKACLINVTHYKDKDGNMRAGIETISPMLRGMEAPKQVNPSILFNVLNYTEEEYDFLPDWMKEKVKISGFKPNGSNVKEVEEGINPDDIPF